MHPNTMKSCHILHIMFALCLLAIMAASPSQAEESNELTKLRSDYNKATERAIAPITKRYEAELKRLKARFTRAADLEGALAVDAELKKLAEANGQNEARAIVSSIHSGVKADIAPLKRGEVYGNNRNYKIARVPAELAGLAFLRLEVHENGDYEVRFEGTSTARLLVVTSPATPINGNELEKAGWTRNAQQITTDSKGKIWVFEREVQNETIQVKSKGDWAYMIASDVPLTIASKE